MASQILPVPAPPTPTRFVALSAAAAVAAATGADLSLVAALPVWVMFMGWVAYHSRGHSARDGALNFACFAAGLVIAMEAVVAAGALAPAAGMFALPLVVLAVALIVVSLRAVPGVNNVLAYFLGLITVFAAHVEPTFAASRRSARRERSGRSPPGPHRRCKLGFPQGSGGYRDAVPKLSISCARQPSNSRPLHSLARLTGLFLISGMVAPSAGIHNDHRDDTPPRRTRPRRHRHAASCRDGTAVPAYRRGDAGSPDPKLIKDHIIMQYKQLGNTGLIVSRLCLGTMTFGDGDGVYEHIGAVDQGAADALARASIDAGVNFFDTADIYSHGQSEERLGRCLRNLGIARDDVVLATKGYMRMGPGRNAVGASRGHIMAAVEASLKRLQVDHIDLYQIHQSDRLTPIDETLRALDDLVRQAKYATSVARTGRPGRWRCPSARRRGMTGRASRRCRPITRSPVATWSER